MSIHDYAFLYETNKDTKTYQHNKTGRVFRTINLPDGLLDVHILDGGRWQYKGTVSATKLVRFAKELN
jgi:hypothetical protein